MSYLGRKGASAALTSADIPDNSITSAKMAGDFDDNIQTNIALLAFKTAVNGSLAKYNLQDQIVDEYVTTAGIDLTASTGKSHASSAFSGTTAASATLTGSPTTGTYEGYTWYKWTADGSFRADIAQNYEYLVVAGGGGGGEGFYGGGGAGGGYRNSKSTGSETTGGGGSVESALSLSADTTYTVTVGDGGAGATDNNTDGENGGDSVFATITATGGGGGGSRNSGVSGGAANGATGGSGGGAGDNSSSGGTAASPTQGFAGGTNNSTQYGAGGGGAGEVGEQGGGEDVNSGAGGDGLSSIIDGSATFRAGGGGGGKRGAGPPAGGNGGGGAGGRTTSPHSDPVDGTDGTGGGGGGGSSDEETGADGGNGVVIIRYLSGGIGDMSLQSLDTEAEAQPTKADMVMLVEDAGSGVGTVNTHIKGHISRDSGTTFTEGVLVDEGDWGTDKRILAFHDLDISGQPADKTMCYKITTHSASSVYDTKIHATSIGWR